MNEGMKQKLERRIRERIRNSNNKRKKTSIPNKKEIQNELERRIEEYMQEKDGIRRKK